MYFIGTPDNNEITFVLINIFLNHLQTIAIHVYHEYLRIPYIDILWYNIINILYFYFLIFKIKILKSDINCF